MNDVYKLVVEYADAFDSTDADYPSTETVVDLAGQPCSPRMARVRNAERRLLDLGSGGMPEPVVNFFVASRDRGCERCWLSSSGIHHSECRRLINRWFLAREALIEYGRELKRGAMPGPGKDG